jgi:acyl-CoA-dependent ceramide synthase
MLVWGYLRHYLNLRILTTFRTIGPWELNWETQQYKCWISQYITFALLASLQAVNLFWWFFICRIAYRFVVYKDADDDRSEYEPSEDETAERKEEVRKIAEETPNGVKRSIESVEAPSTPVQTSATEQPETIGSRVKQRKKGGS